LHRPAAIVASQFNERTKAVVAARRDAHREWFLSIKSSESVNNCSPADARHATFARRVCGLPPLPSLLYDRCAGETAVKTDIDIDADLLKQARRCTGLNTKKAIVEEGLRTLIRMQAQKELLELGGKVEFWDDDLEERARTHDLR
jgi:Arc/MetJ family transcription regulator